MEESGVRDIRPGGTGRERSDRKRLSGSPRQNRSLAPEVEATGSGDGPDAPRVRPTDPFKRAADILFSLFGLVLTAPLWAILPALIKLEDGGPVFHGQERVGKGGERFMSWKFRSMRPRAERVGPPAQAERETDRVTRVGDFMRPRALDELPQLVNVVRGDMSLVGPRALLPEEVEARSEDGEPVRIEELPGYAERHSIRPGLTGLAQTRAPRDLPHREKFFYDVSYVRNRTLWLDLRLIVRSVGISLLGAWPEIERQEGGGERRPPARRARSSA